MANTQGLILESIMRDMSEGVMTIRFDGTITYVNPAALRILCRSGEDMLGMRFAACFFDCAENDAFTQTVLDAVYDRTRPHEAIAPFTREVCTAELEIAREMTVFPKGVNGQLVLSQVTGIGAPYNVTVKVGDTKPQMLKRPIPVRFQLLEGKHGGTKFYYGGIVAVAHDGAVLDTDARLNIYDNVQIDAGGELFAKVTEKTESGALLRYTSLPAGYEAWLKRETEKPASE